MSGELDSGRPGPPGLLPRTLGALALVLPLAVALALPFVTSGRVAIPPIGPVAFAAVALAAAAALGGGEGRRPWDLPAAALLGLAAGHLLLAPGLPRGHDMIPHLWGAWGFLQEVRGGDPFPRWLHQVGLGLPLPQFYGPLNFYLMLPLAALGLPTYAVFKGVFLVEGALAAMAMYALVRQWTGDRRAALVAAAGYAFAPYRLLDVNYRAALGESASFVFLPLVFGALLAALRRGGRRRYSLAALAVALLFLVHPLSTVMAALAVGAWVTLEWFPSTAGAWNWLKRLGASAGIFVLGLALAGFFVLPLAVETPYTSVNRATAVKGVPHLAQHGLSPEQLVTRRLWTDLRDSEPTRWRRGLERPEMPFYAGLGLLALLPLAAGLGRLPGEAGRKRGVPQAGTLLAVLALASLVLTLTPAAHAMARLPVLPILQFSWRFLTIASFAMAAAAGFATARLLAASAGRRWAALLPALVVALLVADGFPYTGAGDWVPGYRGLPHFYRPDRQCGRRWGCWEWQAVAPPPAPQRVLGSLLPPADYGVAASCLRPGYVEYFNHLLRPRITEPGRPSDPARWGVGLVAGPGGTEVIRLEPTAYARWMPGIFRGAWENPGEARPFRRGGGRIEVDLDGRPGSVVLLEQFFPGWEVETPAGWRSASVTRQGLLRAEVAAGQRLLRLRFSGWRWDRIGGWLLTGVTALLLFAPLPGRRGRRGRAREALSATRLGAGAQTVERADGSGGGAGPAARAGEV